MQLSVGRRIAMGALVASALGTGCEPKSTVVYQPATGCSENCVHGPGGTVSLPSTDGGTGDSGGGTGGNGGGATATLLGTVHRVTDPSFTDQGVLFTGAATILGQGPSGDVTVAYGGLTAGTTFSLAGLVTGPSWILVQDGSPGASDVLSTLSPVTLPVVAPVVLPVVDLPGLRLTAASLPSLAITGPSTLAAQVILTFQHGGQPFRGVAVTAGSANAVIAYDTGGGSFSDQNKATGPAGMAILFNAAMNGSAELTVTDTATSVAYQVNVEAMRGGATVASFDLE